MREILYRGKSNYKWFYGDLRHLNDGRVTIWQDGEPFQYEVYPETVGQYTGLTDKNGKSIFEGDIVRLTFSGAVGKIICDINYSIYFNLFGRVVDKLLTDYHCEDIEVIGNETDNPELLKGE